MLAHVARFEVGYQLRRVATHAYFAFLFLYAAVMIARAGGVLGAPFDLVGDGGGTHLNSPYVINLLVTLPSYFGILVVAALMVDAACRERKYGSYPFVYTTPVAERSFLAGRFAGAAAALVYVFSAPALAIWMMTSLPLLPAERVGPAHPLHYLMPYVVTVLPNILGLGGMLFTVAAARRREAPAYALAVALLGGLVLARALSGNLEQAHVAALLDPFGYVATTAVMDRLWTPASRDALPVALRGWVLENRMLWTGVGATLLLALGTLFRFSEPDAGPKKLWQRASAAPSRPTVPNAEIARAAVGAAPTTGKPLSPGPLRLVLHLARFDLRGIVSGIPFRLTLLGLLAVGAALAPTVGTYEGTPSHPATFLVLADLARSLVPVTMLVLLFYAGELVWHEREVGVHEITDASPVPSIACLASKVLAVSGLVVLLLAVVAGSGLLAQLAQGYHRLQPGVYAAELLGFRLSQYLLLGVAALFVHVVVDHKYLGHFVVALLCVALPNLPAFGLTQALVRYASDPGYAYSDFTGYGHFVLPVVVFRLYWAAFAVLLLLASHLLWLRGSAVSLADRLRVARRRLTRPARRVALAAAAAWVALGVAIAYNTRVVNPSEAERERAAAAFEKSYARFASLPQPKIVAVSLDVALHPHLRSFRVHGAYTLRNESDRAIDTVHLCLPRPDLHLETAGFDRGWRAQIADGRHGYFTYALAPSLEPGDEARLSFDLSSKPRGFRAPESAEGVLSNGTLLMSDDFAPHVGYLPSRELDEPARRARYGLPTQPEPPSADAPGALMTGTHRDAHFLRFDATVSTDADQIALAPGRLVGERSRGGRRSFTYRMDRPMLNHYAFVSARYTSSRWRLGDTTLELYSLPEHDFNTARMRRALEASLEYHARTFGPYPYDVLRLVEVPRYARFAGRSYAGLVLCSETSAFLTRLGPPEGPEVDTVSSLIAHEIGHQWWGHQVPAADARGGPFVQETLAQYSRLAVVSRLQGPAAVRQILSYARDDYLRGRGAGSRAEPPLVSVGAEPHVFYSKGLLAMNALAHYAGDQAVAASLAGYTRAQAFRAPPYASAIDLLRRLRAATPDAYRPLVADLFETITFHDSRVVSAEARRTAAGLYRVTLDVEVRKTRADAAGRERDVPPDDWLEIGVFGADGRELLLSRMHIGARRASFQVDVDDMPARAGVDPHGVLIDRDTSDNVVVVGMGSS